MRKKICLTFDSIMKNVILFTGIFLVIAACNKNSNPLPPITTPPSYTNKYAGTYFGIYSESSNGVDSNGVFKNDTSYNLMLKLSDGGNYTFNINKGPLVISSIAVDSTGHFAIVDFNRNIYGHFINDSLYISSKALNGSYNYPQWFVIQELGFAGKKQL